MCTEHEHLYDELNAVRTELSQLNMKLEMIKSLLEKLEEKESTDDWVPTEAVCEELRRCLA